MSFVAVIGSVFAPLHQSHIVKGIAPVLFFQSMLLCRAVLQAKIDELPARIRSAKCSWGQPLAIPVGLMRRHLCLELLNFYPQHLVFFDLAFQETGGQF